MQILLTGFMGAGKTSVGRELASLLAVPFVDLDTEVEERAGVAIAQIFSLWGETRFRELEGEVLSDLLGTGSLVVATGGGTPVHHADLVAGNETRRVVWLHVPLPNILERLSSQERAARPLFEDESEVRALYGERLPAYRRCDVELVVGDEESPRQTAERIRARLRGE